MKGVTSIAIDPPTSSVAVVKPHPASHDQVVKLSAIDQIAPRDYVSICLFFRVGADVDKQQVFEIFQAALFETVKEIPELACCVQKHPDNSREEVELVFDSTRGAEIHFKDYTSPELAGLWTFGSFDQLEQEHFPLNKLPRHHIYGTSAKLEDNVRLPVLVMQLNVIPGGLILGNCLHHVAGDGQCNFIMLSTLGAHFSAIADGLKSDHISQIHLLERSHIVEGDHSAKLEELPDWKFSHDTGTAEFLNPTSYSVSEISTFEYATYFISSKKIAQLKRLLFSRNQDVTYSTVEALAAFLWRHIVSARDIDAEKYPEAKLSITVDSRGRMTSPVPCNYWGNFAEPNAVARLPLAKLQHSLSTPAPQGRFGNSTYHEAAVRVRDALAAVDDTAVRRLVGLLNQMPKSTTLTWNVDRYPGPDMLIVCLHNHRYNDVYFGRELGYSSAFRCTVGDTEGKPDGRCLILPPRRADGRGLEIGLQYDNRTLKRLEKNKVFAEYFERRN